jgi:hypothetical protein
VATTAGTLAETGAVTAATGATLSATDASLGELGINTAAADGTAAADTAAATGSTAANVGTQSFPISDSATVPDATASGAPNPTQITGTPAGTSTQFVPGVDNSIYTGTAPTDVPNPVQDSTGMPAPPNPGTSPLDWFNGLTPETKALTLQALGGAFKGVWDARALTALQQLKNQQTIEQQQRGDASVAELNITPQNISSGGLIANGLNGNGYTSPAAQAATIGAGSSIGGLPALPGILGQNPNLNPAIRTG